MGTVLVKISPKARARVLDLIAAGCGLRVAALVVGCDEQAVRCWLYRGAEGRVPDGLDVPMPCRPLTPGQARRARQARCLILSGASVPDTARAMAVPEDRVLAWLAGDYACRTSGR
ncbi:hypothetical protein ABT071_21880 [Streptomyces sp. NPDC002506]|uniref:hypothetical protein n=1 Tax=Streptomyces sp. NPDC002506 TaxID=3154536 RepID=UPI0033244020